MEARTEVSNRYDVLIIGAGISGIGMACQLSRQCPDRRVAVLERRRAIGGTWDLFRYPGIRSDSDMMTFGYRFRPWSDTRILADGPSIRRYITETAHEHGVDKQVQFGLKVTKANWSGTDRRWTVTAMDERDGKLLSFSCKFLVMATGYYNYDQGHLPPFPGLNNFKGRCIHPQHWPEGLNYRGKRVVVIGSGATAMTLVPAMAKDTAHITMLQRSPSYVYSLPATDRAAAALKGVIPENWIYAVSRARNIRVQRSIYKLSRRFPKLTRATLLALVRRQVGKDFDMTHFTPRYMPWDERLCVVPNGDIFKVLRDGKASVVTDHIEHFTDNGILLQSGRMLEADIVVAATGLQVQSLGGMELTVNGRPEPFSQRMTYKAVLIQDVPNLAYLFGYTNISWSLKTDMAAEYVCRLLKEMDRRGASAVTPRAPHGEMQDESILGSLQSGYVQRGNTILPRQGHNSPWRVLHNFERDRAMFRAAVTDPALEWGSA